MPRRSRMCQQYRYTPGVPLLLCARVIVQVPSLRESPLEPSKVTLEMVGHQDRRAGGFFDDGLEGLELGGVDFGGDVGPVAFRVKVDCSVGELQALHRERCSVEHLD